jgi:hypothetical protein
MHVTRKGQAIADGTHSIAAARDETGRLPVVSPMRETGDAANLSRGAGRNFIELGCS